MYSKTLILSKETCCHPATKPMSARPGLCGAPGAAVPTVLKGYCVEGDLLHKKIGRTEPRPNLVCAFGSLQYTLHLLLVIDCGACDLLARRIFDR
jgi:hypothetical protein